MFSVTFYKIYMIQAKNVCYKFITYKYNSITTIAYKMELDVTNGPNIARFLHHKKVIQ